MLPRLKAQVQAGWESRRMVCSVLEAVLDRRSLAALAGTLDDATVAWLQRYAGEPAKALPMLAYTLRAWATNPARGVVPGGPRRTLAAAAAWLAAVDWDGELSPARADETLAKRGAILLCTWASMLRGGWVLPLPPAALVGLGDLAARSALPGESPTRAAQALRDLATLASAYGGDGRDEQSPAGHGQDAAGAQAAGEGAAGVRSTGAVDGEAGSASVAAGLAGRLDALVAVALARPESKQLDAQASHRSLHSFSGMPSIFGLHVLGPDLECAAVAAAGAVGAVWYLR